MKKPKSLKECKTAEEVENYIVEHDGLSDVELDELNFVEVGPDEDFAEIIPVPVDSETSKKIRAIAEESGRTPSEVLRDWAASICRHDVTPKKPKTRATG